MFETPSGGWTLATVDGVLLLGAGIAAIAVLWSLFDMFTSSTLSGLPTLLNAPQFVDGLPDGVVPYEAPVFVAVTASLGYRVAWWLTGPATGLLALIGFVSLRRIVMTARAGDPFVAANVNRLIFLAALAGTYFALQLPLSFLARKIQHDLGFEGAVGDPHFWPVYIAWTLFTLAEIWRRGVELREEQRLTI